MSVKLEKEVLQALIALGSLVPMLAGGAGMLNGSIMLGEASANLPAGLDSHFRYLSGLLLALGLGFLSCVPNVEAKGRRFRLLGGIVLVGGAGRAMSLIQVGWPSLEHRLALVMELGVVPLLLLWQWRMERLCRSPRASPFHISQGAAGHDPTTPLYMASDRK